MKDVIIGTLIAVRSAMDRELAVDYLRISPLSLPEEVTRRIGYDGDRTDLHVWIW